MSLAGEILDSLERSRDHVLVAQPSEGGVQTANGRQLAALVAEYRRLLRRSNLPPGARCALLGANSIAWIAADIALLAEGAVSVPLYPRQRPEELAAILRDVEPALWLSDSAAAVEEIRRAGVPDIEVRLLSEAKSTPSDPPPLIEPARDPADDDPVSIIYTSGTSGEPKGVVLNGRNLEFMVAAASRQLDSLGGRHRGDPVFHYLPFCFAGSWIMLLVSLIRGTVLTLNSEPTRLAEELVAADPVYFQNVPMVLDRIRHGIEAAMRQRSGLASVLWRRALAATASRGRGSRPALSEVLSLQLARALVFPAIRRRLGRNLRWLICGSAPLAADAQAFFEMLGISVLQVYGLTETTAICTMDSPGDAVAGRVGRAVPGVELRLGEHDEILVRGPNVFERYWNRPQATAAVFVDGWFRTGDQGEVDASGRWRILGRLKDIVVLSSGHNVAPEPIEDELATRLPAAEQIMIVGDGRPHLSVVVTGAVDQASIERVLAEFNSRAPRYKRIRGSIVLPEEFSIDNGLLTANGKLRRGAVCDTYAERIEGLYSVKEEARA